MSEENKPLDIIDINIEITQRYLSYIMKVNNEEVNYFNESYILNKRLMLLFRCMKKAYINEKKLTIEIIFDYCKNDGIEISKNDIELIYNSFNDYDIKYLRKQLEEQYIKQILNKKAFEDVLVNLTSAGDININKLKEFNDHISKGLAKIENYEDISFKKDIDKYEEYYNKKEEGKIKERSVGDPLIDKFLAYPGEAGDMLGLAMRTGTGKTTLAINWANYLTNIDTPVIYICLDMNMRPLVTRIMCCREGITMSEYNMKDKPEKLQNKIKRALNRYKQNKHFILYSEPSASVSDIDKFIYRAKDQFKEDEILDDEEYVVVIIDTLDIVDEFGGADAYGSQDAINQLHAVVRKHKCFCINLLQINESKLRGRRNLKPEDIDELKTGMEDIWGSSAYSKRSRVVLVGERLRFLKMKMFPEHEDYQMWEDMEEDILTLSCVKQNDGQLFTLKYIFDPLFYRVIPKKE